MPELQLDDARIHHLDTAHGNHSILFLHGFMWDRRLFEAQVDALKPNYRCLCPDFRGHGLSTVTDGGGFWTGSNTGRRWGIRDFPGNSRADAV